MPAYLDPNVRLLSRLVNELEEKGRLRVPIFELGKPLSEGSALPPLDKLPFDATY